MKRPFEWLDVIPVIVGGLFLVLVFGALVYSLTNETSGIIDASAYEPYKPDSGRFELSEDCGTLHVYTDTETGAQYVVTDGGSICRME